MKLKKSTYPKMKRVLAIVRIKYTRTYHVVQVFEEFFNLFFCTNQEQELITLCICSIEFYIGRRAHINLCVSNAMRDDLQKRGIKYAVRCTRLQVTIQNADFLSSNCMRSCSTCRATTLYDRPINGKFRRLEPDERQALFARLAEEYSEFYDLYCFVCTTKRLLVL